MEKQEQAVPDSPAILQVNNIAAAYDGVTKILKDVTLHLHAGQTLSIVGVNLDRGNQHWRESSPAYCLLPCKVKCFLMASHYPVP